jgi:hypothetical protein
MGDHQEQEVQVGGEATTTTAPPASDAPAALEAAAPTEQQQQTMQIDPAPIVEDANFEKRYDEMQKEVERGIMRLSLSLFWPVQPRPSCSTCSPLIPRSPYTRTHRVIRPHAASRSPGGRDCDPS